MKRLDFISRTGTNTARNITTKLQLSSPPIFITNELAHAIQGICGYRKEVSDHPEPTDYPQKRKKARRPSNSRPQNLIVMNTPPFWNNSQDPNPNLHPN